MEIKRIEVIERTEDFVITNITFNERQLFWSNLFDVKCITPIHWIGGYGMTKFMSDGEYIQYNLCDTVNAFLSMDVDKFNI